MAAARTNVIWVLVAAAAVAIAVLWPRVPAAQPPAPIATAAYRCDGGKSLTAAYYKGAPAPTPAPGEPPTPTGSVALLLSDGRVMTLNQTISADGGRYANADESFVFWSRGNGAFVQEHGQKTMAGCIRVVPEPAGQDLAQAYANSAGGFSLRLPSGYAIDEAYRFQESGPGKDIPGIKFTIPAATAAGTNLGADTYLSVEEIPYAPDCSAALFLDHVVAHAVTDGGTEYSVASSTGAGAGNRYFETVYAIPGTNPCIAVRYFIHYGVFENWPAGAVRRFDEPALLSQFDAIRRTLTVSP